MAKKAKKEETTHALLGASSAKRWLNCTPSARLEEAHGKPDKGSVYADEGTKAHSLAEAKICYYIIGSLTEIEYAKIVKDLAPDTEMDEATELYVDLVTEKFNVAKATTHDAMLLVEQKLDYSQYVPGGYGTADTIIIADGEMEVIDLKYGKGIPVYAEENPQARLYAIGAVLQFGFLYNIESVASTIVQPRLENVSTEVLSIDVLLTWAEEYVRPRASLADQGIGEYCTGDHCTFCKAKAVCRARAEEALSIAKHDYARPPILDDSEIPGILLLIDKAEAWLKDIKDYAYRKAVDEKVHWDGFKLVEGRSNRVYVDEKLVEDKLVSEGYEADTIYAPKKLLGITAMEKAIGKKNFAEHLETLIIKPAGALTLVPESDKREAVNSAAEDFKEEK